MGCRRRHGRRRLLPLEAEDVALQVDPHARDQPQPVDRGDRVLGAVVHVVGAVLLPVADVDGGQGGTEERHEHAGGQGPLPPRDPGAQPCPDSRDQEDDQRHRQEKQPPGVLADLAHDVVGELRHLSGVGGGDHGVEGAEDVVVDQLRHEHGRDRRQCQSHHHLTGAPTDEAGHEVHRERGHRREQRRVGQTDVEERCLGPHPQDDLQPEERREQERGQGERGRTGAPSHGSSGHGSRPCTTRRRRRAHGGTVRRRGDTVGAGGPGAPTEGS